MKLGLKRIFTIQFIFLFITLFFNYLFFSFILDLASSQKTEKQNFPGIDIKEFR